jgi:hypothetical protein
MFFRRARRMGGRKEGGKEGGSKERKGNNLICSSHGVTSLHPPYLQPPTLIMGFVTVPGTQVDESMATACSGCSSLLPSYS